jgi:nicotinamide-nucleotide amidase
MNQVYLIVIGQELLQGKTLERNFGWLAPELFKHHLQLVKVDIIPDEISAITQAMSEGSQQAQIVLMTGGLGPTQDDQTKLAWSEFLKGDLEFNQRTRDLVTQHYARIDRNFSEVENGYDHIPLGSDSIPNPVGLAPGLFAFKEDRLFFALPGVPREFQAMFKQEVLPKILDQSQGQNQTYLQNLVFRTWGCPEEKIFSELTPHLWDDLAQIGSVSSLPHLWGVDIGVQIQAKHSEQLKAKAAQVRKVVYASKIPSILWQEGEKDLFTYTLQLIAEKKLSFGFAESCTGGLLSHLFTEVPGVSTHFKGSAITYQNQVKENLVGVSSESLSKYGAVSSEVAEEMALGLAKQLKVDIALSLTGLAGPGGDKNHPVGTIFYGLYVRGKISTYHACFKGDRNLLKMRFAHYGAHLIRDHLVKN